jgi:hypothetical protein
VRALCLQRRKLPRKDPRDPGYRRLRYVRYCDDFLLGFSGPKAEAVKIIQNSLDDLATEPSRVVIK